MTGAAAAGSQVPPSETEPRPAMATFPSLWRRFDGDAGQEDLDLRVDTYPKPIRWAHAGTPRPGVELRSNSFVTVPFPEALRNRHPLSGFASPGTPDASRCSHSTASRDRQHDRPSCRVPRRRLASSMSSSASQSLQRRTHYPASTCDGCGRVGILPEPRATTRPGTSTAMYCMF
jgi:hypothetical protein